LTLDNSKSKILLTIRPYPSCSTQQELDLVTSVCHIGPFLAKEVPIIAYFEYFKVTQLVLSEKKE
jgi:hypothetical protein